MTQDINNKDKLSEERAKRIREKINVRNERKMKKQQSSKVINIVLCVIQALISFVFIGALVKINMLPTLYVLGIAGVILIILALIIVSQFKFTKRKLVGKIISVLLSVLMLVGIVYLMKADATLNSLTHTEIKLENMAVAVMKDDQAEDIMDTEGYIFAIQDMNDISDDKNYYKTIMNEIETQMQCTMSTKAYANLLDEITALQNGQVDAIIYNQAYMDIIEEVSPEIIENIKVIYEYGVEIEIEKEVVDVETAGAEESEDEDEKLENSHIISAFISGIDTTGNISRTSRSDVNVIAMANPDTQQILLITTPRDYYVSLPGVTGGREDKLTHAGIYGVDVSMNTLEELYDSELDYYVRINFSSFTKIVDALGGINVYSEQAFQTTSRDGYSFYVNRGNNNMNGTQALNFARERYNVSGGDFQRGKNHEAIIKGIIEKVASPSIITGAYDILDNISDCIDTNVPPEVIQGLIKEQINTGTSWDIKMVDAQGKTGSAMCYSYSGGKLSVVHPNYDSVDRISEMIDTMYRGEKIQ